MKEMKTVTINGKNYIVDDVDAVSYGHAQELTESQQKQAAENIGAFRNGDEEVRARMCIIGTGGGDIDPIVLAPSGYGETEDGGHFAKMHLYGEDLSDFVRLGGIYDGENDYDAVNKRQLDAAVKGVFRNGDEAVTIGDMTAEYKGGQTAGDYDELTAEVVELSSKNGLDGVVLTGIIESTEPTSAVNKWKLDKASQDAQNSVIERICPSFEKSGKVVTCESVEGYHLTVTAPDATTITRCGVNVFNYKDWIAYCNTAHPSSAYPAVEEVEYLGEKCFKYSLYRSDTSQYFIKLKFKENTQYTFKYQIAFSYLDNDSYVGVSALCIGYGPGDWEYVGSATAYKDKFVEIKHTSQKNKTIKSLFVASFSALGVVYIPIDKFVIQEGTSAEYAPYLGDTFIPGQRIPALPGVNTLYANSGEIAVKGAEDPVKIINDLQTRLAALEAAVVNNA